MPNVSKTLETIPKTDLKRKISKLKIEPRVRVQQALLNKQKRDEYVVDELNESQVDYGVYLKEDFKNVLKALNDFEQNRKENLFIIGELKYENNAFLTQFKKIQSLNPKGLVGNSQSKIDATFNELIRKYKAKGYEIPDFSVKNNLFEIDPLLLSGTRLHEFYNLQPKEVLNNDINTKFIENLSLNVIKRLNKNMKEGEQPEDVSEFIKSNENKDLKAVKKDIRATLKHNNLVKSYFDFKTDKAIKNLMKDNHSKENENAKDASKDNNTTLISKTTAKTKNKWSKNFLSDKTNTKTKSFGVLPNIQHKSPRISNYNNSTIDTTKNITKNTLYKENQNSTIYFDNGTLKNFNQKNKNTFFNNTNINNYNKFIGSSLNSIKTGYEKKFDLAEVNESLDKSPNILIKDMHNQNSNSNTDFREEKWENASNLPNHQDTKDDQNNTKTRNANILLKSNPIDKSSLLNKSNSSKKSNFINNNNFSFLRNTINNENFYNLNFFPEHQETFKLKNLKISPNNLKFYNFNSRSTNHNNMGFLTKTNFKSKKKKVYNHETDKSSFINENSSLHGSNHNMDQSIILNENNILINAGSSSSKKNTNINLKRVNSMETTLNINNVQDNNNSNTNAYNSNHNTMLNIINTPARNAGNNYMNLQTNNQNLSTINKVFEEKKTLKSNMGKNDILNNPTVINNNQKDPNSLTKEERELLKKIGTGVNCREYNNEKMKFLETIYEKLNDKNTNNLKEQTTDYCKRFLNYSNKEVEDLVSKKLEPINIFNSIIDLKSRVSFYDINDHYKDLQEDLMLKTDSRIKLDLKNLTRLKQLDKNVAKLDLEFLRNINKLNDN